MTKRILALITVAVMIFSLIAFPVSAEAVTTSWGSVSVSDTGFTSTTLRANARAAFTWEDNNYIVSYSGTDIYLFDAATYALVDTYSTGLSSFAPTYFYVDTRFQDYPLLYYAIGDTIYKWRFLYGSLDYVGSEDAVGPLVPAVPEVVVDTNMTNIYYFQVMDSAGMIRFVSGTTLCDARIENGVYTVYALKTSTYFNGKTFYFAGDNVYTLYLDSLKVFPKFTASIYKYNTIYDSFEAVYSFTIQGGFSDITNVTAYIAQAYTRGSMYIVNDVLYVGVPITHWSYKTTSLTDGKGRFLDPCFLAFDLVENSEVFKQQYYTCPVYVGGKFYAIDYKYIGTMSYTYNPSDLYDALAEFRYSTIPFYTLSAYKVPTFYTEEDKLGVADTDGDGYDDDSFTAGYEQGKEYSKNQNADADLVGDFFVRFLSAIMSFLLYLGVNISFRGVTILTVVFFIVVGLIVYFIVRKALGGGD